MTRLSGLGPLVSNATSIFESSSAGNLDGTKLWRIQWWQTIEDYTLHGPYFWTGKGFGIGLAEDDGFLVGEEGDAVLRSPHNVNMTILARGGVPGFALWVLLLTSWFAMMLRTVFTARRHAEEQMSRFVLFLACYLLSILIDASFDVALEGPMLGIWFWVLFGIGCGTVLICRARWATHPKGESRFCTTPNASLPRRPACDRF